ncbi:hypothetical protein [Micavibrio aeruginosavorus]|uniref:Peptidase S8/S53 domain-containing protein n=1 Tax=Micavibrio aeruginosavorus (strain ARL-13) TaxID=856793 RepID=G2KP60_MICAA|nr:hypothetical protein [Micavibrio aeruginosavorus]AEP08568.1 hypothetical protein MICA_222 [Micavibrio aeruginosavorus ARL-13]
MGSARTLRSALAATGLAVLSLSLAFNDAAAQTAKQPVAKTAQKNKNDVRTEQDKVLHESLLTAYKAALFQKDDEPAQDIAALVDSAINALDQGANPHLRITQGMNILSPIEVAYTLFAEKGDTGTNASALMKKVLEKGGNKRQITSNDMTIMDEAVEIFLKSEQEHIDGVRKILSVIQWLYSFGFTYSDAPKWQKEYKDFTSIADWAMDRKTLEILKELSLVDEKNYTRLTIGNQNSRDAVQNNTHLTREMLTNNGANIAKIAIPSLPKSSSLEALEPGPTAKNREVDLVTVESKGDNSPIKNHHVIVFTTAVKSALILNPNVDTKNFHHLYESSFRQIRKDNSDIHTALFNNNGAKIADNIVFSTSQGSAKDTDHVSEENVERYEGAIDFIALRESLDQQQKNKITYFIANGNDWFTGGGRMGETSYITHGPRAVTVGASADFRAKNMETERPMIAHYTSFAADICNRTPSFDGEINHGTSNATPALAATYRQMAEWYGDALSFEEIMAAGLMSADRNPWDFKNPGMFKDDKDHSVANNPANFEGQPAHYTSNGGGLPWHERCGAGIINPKAWNNAIQTMIILKERDGLQTTQATAQFLSVHSHEKIGTGRKAFNKYSFVVPEDMTLSRLTIATPGGSWLTIMPIVTTPAGFQFRMPFSETETFSTYAFAYEDVKKGDVITIESRGKMEPGAGIYIRGQKPGNAIAALRDVLRKNGVLPAPVRAMTESKVTGPAEPLPAVIEYPDDPPTPRVPKP